MNVHTSHLRCKGRSFFFLPTLGPGPAPSLVRVTAHALQLVQVVQVEAGRGGLRLFTLICDGRMRAPVTSC